MACCIIQYASEELDGLTIFRPETCAKSASGDSEWCSTAPMPPPYGMRTTTGSLTLPRERACIFASCVTIWSYAGKTKPSNWISTTGR